MRLYENAWPTTYEEIKTWYPVWYREILEMDAFWQVWGKHLDEIQAGIIRAVDNNFIDYADAQTISKLEKWLGIIYDGPRGLEERRNVIKAFVIGSGKIGQAEIIDLLRMFTDGEAKVSFENSTIFVNVRREHEDGFKPYDCYLVLGNRIPAHLGLQLTDNTTAPLSHFATHVTAAAFPGVTDTRLPLCSKEHRFEGKVSVTSAAWTVTETRLAADEPPGLTGLLLVDDIGIKPGWLDLGNSEITPLLIALCGGLTQKEED